MSRKLAHSPSMSHIGMHSPKRNSNIGIAKSGNETRGCIILPKTGPAQSLNEHYFQQMLQDCLAPWPCGGQVLIQDQVDDARESVRFGIRPTDMDPLGHELKKGNVCWLDLESSANHVELGRPLGITVPHLLP